VIGIPYLLRAAGKLDDAAEAANQASDPQTLRTLALERHDWGGLADLVAMALPEPTATQQSAGEIGILASAKRWAGDADGFKNAIDRLKTIGQTNEHLWSAWPQFGVTLIYAAVFLTVGAYLFRKRDA